MKRDKDKNQEEVEEWAARAVAGSYEGIKTSGIYMSLVTDDFLKSPLCALQLGMAILMDKPITLLIKKGTKVPENLKRIAILSEEFEDNKKGIEQASQKLIIRANEHLDLAGVKH